jgi:hypothetical protein
MRKLIDLAICGATFLTSAAFVWSGEEDARALINKSIQAVGGEKALAKHKAATFKEKGTYYGLGDGLPYTGSYAFQHPAQFRMEIDNAFTIVFDVDKGWINTGGDVKEMTKEQVANQKNEQRVRYMSSLLPLRDKAFTLTTLPDVKVDKQDARGVKATRKDWPEVKLYFNKANNYLVKIEYKTIAEDLGNKEVTIDVVMSDFKDVAGAKVAQKRIVNRDGKIFVDSEITEMNAAGKLDAKVFAMPK